jgi:hypothetical protein
MTAANGEARMTGLGVGMLLGTGGGGPRATAGEADLVAGVLHPGGEPR